ncbi:sensor histidine kinase [Dactylosporangium sucinum]|uniref:histidine kinase n=1 Tax=Dactylosporangium sucinum TaxID=1424081 RepID=A0A917TYY4_9ACTN|nr:ATP-binding protein [Dactylosporangium sucinum]GGM45092.1 two-component sensor histidine kinase [Dactylosporangium sucinum]
MRHPSIRLRLTVVYAIVLVVACAALLALNYWLLYHSLYNNIHDPTPAELAKMRSTPPDIAPELGEKLRAVDIDAARIAERRRETLLGTAGTSAIGLLVTAVAGLGISWIVAGRLLRPLRTLTATTRRISQDRLDERIALTGPHDELHELADTFDAMIGRLESAFASQRRFVADAAHDLRTPLAIVRTGLEVQLAKRQATVPQWEEVARRALTATSRAERMLDGLLALARSDSGVLALEPCDLALAAATALSAVDEEAVDLTVTSDLRPAPVTGDPVLLDRLAANLVDNAVRHNHPGGRVSVSTGPAGLTVRNSGPAVPPEDLDRLFEPFQRLASGRAASPASTGLGLAIVRSIVHAHAGTITATPNPQGGLTVTVALPAR